VPENAYAVAFDARELKDGHFALHPKNGGCWSDKKNAERFAICAWEDNGQPAEHNCFWTVNATTTSVPLYCVARVVKVGGVSHMGETLVEVAFDYGTPWMQGSKRKALREHAEKAGIKVLSKKEYEKLLPTAIKFFMFDTEKEPVKKAFLSCRSCPEGSVTGPIVHNGLTHHWCAGHAKEPICGVPAAVVAAALARNVQRSAESG
jgi:hypothetical protein